MSMPLTPIFKCAWIVITVDHLSMRMLPFLGEMKYLAITFFFSTIASVIGPEQGISLETTVGSNSYCKTNKQL